MAPIAVTTPTEVTQDLKYLGLDSKNTNDQAKPSLQWFSQTGRPDSEYPYARFLPHFDFDTKYEPLTEFEHVDPGHKAKGSRNPRAFLAGGVADDITPKFGSEVTGVQLDQLDDEGRAQLALYVAQRGVVAFRDQDFVDRDPEWHIHNWGEFFGRPHIHPTSPHPVGIPHYHLVYRAPDSNYNNNYHSGRLTATVWHSDVTYEKQPPGLTALFLFDSPPNGGDTSYADQREAYNRLSPSLAAYLETLEVVHSGFEQVADSRRRGGIVRREPVENTHPLIRRHPVTGEKALFVNPGFSRRIVGLKQEESDALLKLLFTHIERGHDFQTRIRWQPRTVVLWDNRITAHNANIDFDSTPYRRHGTRITPQAERPFL